MKRKIFIIIAVIAALWVGLVAFESISKTDTAQTTQTAATVQPVEPVPLNADTIYRLVNDERMKAGLQPLLRDARLDATAQERADDMTARNYYSHFDPIDGHALLDDQDPQCTGLSENISYGHSYDETVVSGWMGSPAHHDAILKADYILTGVAVSNRNVVQHFCIAR